MENQGGELGKVVKTQIRVFGKRLSGKGEIALEAPSGYKGNGWGILGHKGFRKMMRSGDRGALHVGDAGALGVYTGGRGNL